MHLLDELLPDYSFREIHSRNIRATPESALNAALAYRPEGDPFFRTAISIRELPLRVLSSFRPHASQHRPPFGLSDFTLLEFRPGKELSYGLVGQFWKADYGLEKIEDKNSFVSFSKAGVPKLVFGIRAEPNDNNQTKLITETRIYCPDSASYRRFWPYWYLIRPVSGALRGRILKSIQKTAEQY